MNDHDSHAKRLKQLMSNKKNEAYQLYRREFRMLRERGVRLYCPEGVEMTPGRLAKTICGDSEATYMRDTIYDGEGRPVRINFMRIDLKK